MNDACTIEYLPKHRVYKLVLQDERGTLLYFTPVMLNARNLAERMLQKPLVWERTGPSWNDRVVA